MICLFCRLFVLGAQPPFVYLVTSLKTAQVLRYLFLNLSLRQMAIEIILDQIITCDHFL